MKPNSQDETLFDAARRLVDADQRRAFLDQACKDDPDQRQRVEALLTAQSQADQFFAEGAAALELPPGPPPDDSSAPPRTNGTAEENPGDYIGRYKLREKIGEGGCGVVYVAEQEEPVRRRVALKIIKLGMDTRQVIARFEAERQALAMMGHQNIAKVFDGGVTGAVARLSPAAAPPGGLAREHPPGHVPAGEAAAAEDSRAPIAAGRPYFVMELVRGVKLTEYCDQNRLDTRRRLELFIQVCQAVQHAHQKGIIHRDLKPSNILVTSHDGMPVPKVIDFGIAKATEGRLTDLTIYTELHQFIGTPAYMSPEQAGMSGLDVDTRSDIYSLGVLLYELLTGRTPFDPRELLQAGVEAMRKTIRETEPPRPSTRVAALRGEERSTTALRHATEPPRLVSLLRGDLDWVVMKCLEKDRTRRYETANGLARDLERHLNSEPVVARPPSSLYRFQKLVRRNKLVFAAGGAVAAALVGGLVFALIGFTEARRERDRALAAEQLAESEGERSKQVAQFMKDMLKGVGPAVALGRDTTMLREILDQTAKRIEELKGHPAIEAELRTTIGEVYFHIGEYARCEEMNRTALALRRELHGTDEHLDVADSIHRLGWALFQFEKHDEAAALFRQALDIRRRLLPEDHPSVADSLYGLARMLSYKPTLEEAERLHLQALEIRRRIWGEQHADIAHSLYGLGRVLREQHRLDEAERVLGAALAMRKKLFGDEHPAVAQTLHLLSGTLQSRGKLREAERFCREALQIRRKFLSEDHPAVSSSVISLVDVLIERGELTEAENVYLEALALRENALAQRISVADRTGNKRDSEVAGKSFRDELEPASNDERSPLAYLLRNLGGSHRKQGRFNEAKRIYLEAAAIGDAHALDRAAWFLATCPDPAGRDENAAVAFAEKAVAASNRKEARILDTLAAAYGAVGRFAEAARVQQEAMALLPDGNLKAEYESRLRLFQANTPCREYDRLGNLLRNQGKFAEAETMYRQELAMRRIMFGDDHPEVAFSLYDIAHALQGQGKFRESEAPARECLKIREQRLPDDWRSFDARSLLGQTLLGQKKHEDSEPLLVSGYEGLKQCETRIPSRYKPRLKETLRSIIQLYEETNRPEQAAEWQQKLTEFEVTEREKKAVAAEP